MSTINMGSGWYNNNNNNDEHNNNIKPTAPTITITKQVYQQRYPPPLVPPRGEV